MPIESSPPAQSVSPPLRKTDFLPINEQVGADEHYSSLYHQDTHLSFNPKNDTVVEKSTKFSPVPQIKVFPDPLPSFVSQRIRMCTTTDNGDYLIIYRERGKPSEKLVLLKGDSISSRILENPSKNKAVQDLLTCARKNFKLDDKTPLEWRTKEEYAEMNTSEILGLSPVLEITPLKDESTSESLFSVTHEADITGSAGKAKRDKKLIKFISDDEAHTNTLYQQVGVCTPKQVIYVHGSNEYNEYISLLLKNDPDFTHPEGNLLVMEEVKRVASKRDDGIGFGWDDFTLEEFLTYLPKLAEVVTLDLILGNTDRLLSSGSINQNRGNIMLSQSGPVFIDQTCKFQVPLSTKESETKACIKTHIEALGIESETIDQQMTKLKETDGFQAQLDEIQKLGNASLNVYFLEIKQESRSERLRAELLSQNTVVVATAINELATDILSELTCTSIGEEKNGYTPIPPEKEPFNPKFKDYITKPENLEHALVSIQSAIFKHVATYQGIVNSSSLAEPKPVGAVQNSSGNSLDIQALPLEYATVPPWDAPLDQASNQPTG